MDKAKHGTEFEEATPITMDYMALKECMKEAIKEALQYERKRRERAIVVYVSTTVVCCILLLVAAAQHPVRSVPNYAGIIGLAGLGVTHVLFYIWALTRWF